MEVRAAAPASARASSSRVPLDDLRWGNGGFAELGHHPYPGVVRSASAHPHHRMVGRIKELFLRNGRVCLWCCVPMSIIAGTWVAAWAEGTVPVPVWIGRMVWSWVAGW